MQEKTNSLESAYLEESAQAARFELFAMRAVNEDRPRLAAFFRAVARAKNVHAAKALMQLRGKIGDNEANLAEARESLAALPEAFSAFLDATHDGPVQSLLTQFLKTSMNHKVVAGRFDDAGGGDYHVCTVCGFIAEGAVPERCPVCHALPSKFESV
ncbi:rubredoxin-like domain-containing protein [Salidesulfovibrio brasiliensis]